MEVVIVEQGTKVCRTCEVEKGLGEFYKHHARCKPCYLDVFRPRSRRSYERRKRKDPEKVRLIQRRSWVKSKYGLEWGEYLKLEESCGGRCVVCGCVPEGELNVDHDHETGVIRGLLCRECNLGLGNFKDDIELLLKAAEYLEAAAQRQVI